MSLRRFPALAVTLFAVVAPAALAAAAPDTPLPAPDNAALLYWQALAQLPPRDARQEKILAEWQTAPLDADAQKLIESGANCLKYLHHGTKLRRCDWGMPFEEGMNLIMPHLAKARDLGRLSCLRARHRFQHGDAAGAVEDVDDALVLARHVSAPPIPISMLVSYVIENSAIDAAAANLPGLDPTALKRLADSLSALPPSAPLRDSVRFEQEFGQRWLVRQVQAAAGKPDWEQVAFRSLFVPDEDPRQAEEVRAALQAVSGSPQGAIEQLAALGPYYPEAAKLLSLPPEQARAQLAALHEKMKANPFAKLILPTYTRVYDAHARTAARAAMLKAAVAIAAGGAEKVKDSRDPYDHGAFEHAALPQGFELKSKLTVDGKPVTLRVGAPKQ
jgi:hypothetical protein